MKIKAKKSFGEKHRLRARKTEELIALNEKLFERTEDLLKKHRESLRESLESSSWRQRILTLSPGDACEFYKRPDWLPAVFVQHVAESEGQRESWRVRDIFQKAGLRARYVRVPGDQEAWPGLNAPKPEAFIRAERKLAAKLAAMGRQHVVPEDVVPDPVPDAQGDQ